jgi:NAD(P)-dependent dehydrogenase (short-subunit alcohol dehydrogenase family)
MSEQRSFPDLTAIVTGGTRGIGLAIAATILERGGRVVATGAREESVERARRALGHADRVEVVLSDVRQPEAAVHLVDRTVARFGGLDVLVNNAGLGYFASAADTTIEQWREVIDTNLSGVFYCCKAAIPALRARGGGWIINISSLAGKNSFVGGTAYCASKAGLNAFSEALMQEVRHDGIRVSYVMPGSVSTEFGGRAPGPGEAWKLTAEDVAQVVIDLLEHPQRSLPSRVELRPSQPPRKG